MKRPLAWYSYVLPSAAALLLAANSPGATQEPNIVVRGATVLPMTGGDDALVLANHSIVCSGGKIVWVGPRSEEPAGEGVVVDADGLFVIPGLIDAHVHLLDETQLALYLANGITTVFNLSGNPRTLEWRERTSAGELLGPRIYTTGPQVKESATPAIDTEITVPPVAGAADLVRMHVEQGFDFMKIWSSIDPYLYEALVSECRRQGLRVTGHVPSRVGLRGVLHAGQGSIAHVEEFLNKYFGRQLDRDGLATLGGIVEGEDLVVITTLITYAMIADTMDDERLAARMARKENEYLDPMLLELWGSEQNDWWQLRRRQPGTYYDDALRFKQAIAAELHLNGVTLLAGSDSGLIVANIVPGWSLHRELELLVESGLSTYATLQTATVNSGRFLAAGSGRGTISAGAPADLLILGSDPLASIANTRSIQGVVTAGRHLDRDALDELLARTRARQEPSRIFLATRNEADLDAAIESTWSAHEAGDPIPTEASLFIAAYQLAAAGEIELALAVADLNARLHAESYLPAYALAGLFEMQGDIPAAIEGLHRALELCPKHPMIDARLEALEK